jgi:hypothetical protein
MRQLPGVRGAFSVTSPRNSSVPFEIEFEAGQNGACDPRSLFPQVPQIITRNLNVVATAPTSAPVRTVAEQVLLAARHLEEDGQNTFTAEALIVSAWKINPSAFGLKGFAERFPDSNKVLSVIMGERGLARQGLLDKVGVKQYTLTERGRKMIAKGKRGLRAEEGPLTRSVRGARGNGLSREADQLLIRLSASVAASRFRFNAKDLITFPLACQFWGVTATDSTAVRAASERTRSLLAKIEDQFPNQTVELSNGHQFNRHEVSLLRNVQTFLKLQFDRQLNPPPKPLRRLAGVN